MFLTTLTELVFLIIFFYLIYKLIKKGGQLINALINYLNRH